MPSYQKKFIELALEHHALRFGSFTLKSGRQSPYFFNAGALCSGHALNIIGQAYAQTIQAASLSFDVVFGPAYKGIPLACATAMALASRDAPIPYAFNRKEVKDHGEGGILIGAPLNQRVLIIDDVITAGTAIRESLNLIEQAKGTPVGIVVAFDRQEKGQSQLSAVEEISEQYRIPVLPIIRFCDLLEYVHSSDAYHHYYEPLWSYAKNQAINLEPNVKSLTT